MCGVGAYWGVTPELVQAFPEIIFCGLAQSANINQPAPRSEALGIATVHSTPEAAEIRQSPESIKTV